VELVALVRPLLHHPYTHESMRHLCVTVGVPHHLFLAECESADITAQIVAEKTQLLQELLSKLPMSTLGSPQYAASLEKMCPSFGGSHPIK